MVAQSMIGNSFADEQSVRLEIGVLIDVVQEIFDVWESIAEMQSHIGKRHFHYVAEAARVGIVSPAAGELQLETEDGVNKLD